MMTTAGMPTDLPPGGIAAMSGLPEDPSLAGVTALSEPLDSPAVRCPPAKILEELVGTDSAFQKVRVVQDVIDALDASPRT